MKTVALIHYRFIEKGGLERRLINYMNFFSKMGYQVTILSIYKDPNIILPKNVYFEEIKIRIIPKQVRQLFFAQRIKKVLDKKKFDIIFTLGRTYPSTIIVDGGNHYGYRKCLNIRLKSYQDYISNYLEKKAFCQASVVLACSSFVKQLNMEGYKTDENKIKVLHPPINIAQFNQDNRINRNSLRHLFHIKDNKTTFLFVSTGHIMKNLKFLLQVFTALENDNVELLIAGSNPKMKLPTNTRYIGYYKEPEKLFMAVDYTIHPALFEAFGQVIMESIQCGTPVIISSNTGAKELVSPNEGVIVDSFVIEDWVQVIRTIRQRKFNIRPDFATHHQLTLEQHMQKLLQYAESI